jgi:hypothetical protein
MPPVQELAAHLVARRSYFRDEAGHEVARVIAFVGGDGDPMASTNALDHHDGGVALVVAVGRRHYRLRETTSVLLLGAVGSAACAAPASSWPAATVTERQARFLTTVMLHAGVCVPRQYARFCDIVHGEKT